MGMVSASMWFLWTGMILTWTGTGLVRSLPTSISHTTIPPFSFFSIPSLAPIFRLQLQIPHQSTQLLHLFISLLELPVPRGTWYRSVYLIWPFSEAKLFLFLLMLPILTSFMSSLLPCGSPRRPHRLAFSVASQMSFRHFPVRESLSNQNFVGDSHRWRQLGAPKMRLLGLISIGLTTYLQNGFRISCFGLFSAQTQWNCLIFLSDSLSFFTLYSLGKLSTTFFSFFFLYL